jgi:hypothetical protein
MAMATPVLIGSLGVAIDFVNFTRVKATLQTAADAAAVAGAREMQVAKSDETQIASAAISFAAHKLTGNADATTGELKEHHLAVEAQVLTASSAVKVNITESWTPFFAHFLNATITPVQVTATARFVGSNNICVLGLDSKGRAVHLDKGSRLTGNDCGVYSNSTDKSGFQVDKNAQLVSSLNCVAGGKNIDSLASVAPAVLTDCPATNDPLISRSAPSTGGCDHTDMKISDESKVLNPGTYCGGLEITGSATVTLNAGTFIIKDGKLLVSGQATLNGENVSFFLTGASSGPMLFAANSHISLSAPESGAMAGLLFFEDRNIGVSLKHRITSNDARKLVGTIYFPVGDLVIDAKDPVADQSAYTAIIVNRLELNMGPNLVLNSDYDNTSVPVPEGLAGTGQVVLTE